MKSVHLVDFINTLHFNIVISELNSNLFLKAFFFEIGIKLLLSQLEIPCKIKLVWNSVTIFHFMLLLIRGELVHDGSLDSLLLLAHTRQSFLYVRVLHLVLSQAENEVVGEILDPPEDVYTLAVLRVKLLRLQLLSHPAQHLDVVGVVHRPAHE